MLHGLIYVMFSSNKSSPSSDSVILKAYQFLHSIKTFLSHSVVIIVEVFLYVNYVAHN